MNAKVDLTDAQLSRALVSSQTIGTLCTLAVDPAGYPFGSVLPYVLDEDGSPIFLASTLAEHTTNFLADPRASLIVSESGEDADPLALQRVTLLGKISEIPPDSMREPYLAAHPQAKLYVDMKDFAFYRLTVESVRYVGGFGRMSWVGADEYSMVKTDV